MSNIEQGPRMPHDGPVRVEVLTHDLKTWPGVFDDVWCELKRFELRDRTDRSFRRFDKVLLREWSPDGGYTGRAVHGMITYVLNGGMFGLPENMCVFSFTVHSRENAHQASAPTLDPRDATDYAESDA